MIVTAAEARRAFQRTDLYPLVSAGVLSNRKTEGSWLYYPADEDSNAAIHQLDLITQGILREHFMIPLRWLPAMALKRMPDKVMSRDAATILSRSLLRRGSVVGVGLLTRDDYQPYLAIHSTADLADVTRMIDTVREQLARVGVARWSDIPNPRRWVRVQGWRQTILLHCEFLGLGAMRDRNLVAWARI